MKLIVKTLVFTVIFYTFLITDPPIKYFAGYYSVGEWVQSGDLLYKVIETQKEEEDGKKYIILKMIVKNNTNESKRNEFIYFKLYDEMGASYSPNLTHKNEVVKSDHFFGVIKPQETKKGNVCFEVKSDHELKLYIHGLEDVNRNRKWIELK